MGRWQPEGLTEGLLALPSRPLHHRFAAVPLPIASRQGGLFARKTTLRKSVAALWAARAGLALRMIAPVPERA